MGKHFYEFGPFRIDLTERVLLRDGQPVQLTPKAFETLLVLVQHCGHVVEKDELMNRIWPDTFVEEVGLARNISALRKVLEDGSDQHQYIETIPKRGYRFRAEVREWEEGISEQSAERKQPPASAVLSAPGAKARNGSLRESPAILGTRLPRWIWVTASVAVLSAAGLGWWLARTGTRTAEVAPTVVPLTSYLGVEAQPSFSPDGSQVAFSWNGEKQDNFDIYVKLIGPGSQLRLTTALEVDSCPAWSPDGRSIAFVREGSSGNASVFLTSPLGPPERKVAEISPTGMDWPRGLAWAPDGKSLIVTDRNSDGEPLGLFLVSVESGERQRLTTPPQKVVVDSQPTFSPDAHTLAFIRNVGVGIRDIYLLPLSKDFHLVGESRRLTFENQLVFSPAWTLDGQQVIFSSGPYLGPNLFRVATSGSGKPQRLATVGEDGSEVAISHRTHRLVYTRQSNSRNIWCLEVPAGTPKRLIASTRIDGHPQFSPDGKKIAFSSNRRGDFDIWICGSDGSNPQQLTSRGVYCASPHWSPDGQQIAFDSGSSGASWKVYLIGINGGKPKPLTNGLATDWQPSWSLDGKWIYFTSNRSGEDQVWKVPSRGGDAVPVTHKGGFFALESQDGKWVYYSKRHGATSLWKVPSEGGEESQVLESVDWAFAIVQEGIYFILPGPESTGPNPCSIRFFDFATKEIRTIFTNERAMEGYLSISPDGKQILYSQMDQEGSDLVLVENFR
jgi:Tol biopolymer transport system component/DNA-binding winged helix-turn-helix (wHTH) protein